MNQKLILSFLSDLKGNNNREWFEENKPTYKKALKSFQEIVEKLIPELSHFDPLIGQLKPKDCVFRIYRDVRFSKNKAPYKDNFGAAISRGGRKSPFALYYIHIEDNNSFLAGGIYMPESEILRKVRQEIDYNAEEFKKIINDASFKKYFGNIQGEKLKRAPKGYSPDDENIELLKHKSYIAVHNINNDIFKRDDFINYAVEVYQACRPMNDFINRALID